MKCPKCQREYQVGDKFCRECGAKLPSVCPQCGKEIKPDDKFCSECGTPLVVTKTPSIPRLEDMQKQMLDRIPQSLADRLFASAKQMQGEYRLVTALFADVSGSSTMAKNMPLEQYIDIINECFKIMVDTISVKYEGSINRFIGDCVLAFFGAPITHENDAERAIMSALDIRDNVKTLGLEISIGINTGITYFGEMGNSLLYIEHSAWGPDVDFAKRLQESALPGKIYVGASTYRLTRKAFDFDDPVDIQVKGTDKPQTAYPVLRVKVHPEKLRGIEGLRSRMIGREREFTDLKNSADELISGRGQITVIIGEAGLGKSRLATELKSYIKDKNVQFYEGRCVSIGQVISYWPFLDILRSYLNLTDKDTTIDIAKKLKRAITELFPQRYEDILAFVSNLMSIKIDEDIDKRVKYYNPEQIRHQTQMALRNVFIALSNRKPLLLILEDLHWADDLSLELISLLMDELSTNPIMLLCIYRPERQHKCWKIADTATRKCIERYTEITLKQLSKTQSRQLVESLLEIDNLPETTKDMILSKSEGNPFFIEEVIRFLMDSDIIYHEGERWKARKEIADIDVPDTIQSVLLSRVDRLQSETKYVLHCASVIGRLFRYRLLDHLLQHEKDLEGHLFQLEERDLIREERTIPEIEYTFKHALMQEATYQGILERKRQELHKQIAEGIEDLYRDKLEDFYEELAHHYKLGGNEEKTIYYLLKAGIKLANQFANRQALDCFNQAEMMISNSPSYRSEKALLYEKRGEVLQFVGQWSLALKDYNEALRWSDNTYQRARIYQKIGWLECEEIQDKVSALKHLEMGLKELPEDDKSVERVRLELYFGWANASFECIRKPLEDMVIDQQRVAKIADEMGYKSELALLYAAIEKWHSWLGDYSDELGQKAIAIAEEAGDLPTLARVYWIVGHSRYQRRGKHWTEQSIPYLLKGLELSERIGDIQNQIAISCYLGNAYDFLGLYENAFCIWKKLLDMSLVTNNIMGLHAASNIMNFYNKCDHRDILLETFNKLMQSFASLEIDEESQAWALIVWQGGVLNSIYNRFQSIYQSLGMKSADEMKKILEGLLCIVKSKPQRAWYLSKLMELCLELGDVKSAESYARDVIKINQSMASPDCMLWTYPSYLLIGDVDAANTLVYRFIIPRIGYTLMSHLSNIELTYKRYGYEKAFQLLCDKLQQENKEELRRAEKNQLYLKPVYNMLEDQNIWFYDKFNEDSLDPNWHWEDPEGISSYTFHHNPDYISISAFNGSSISEAYSAPRLLQYISGNFAIETRLSGGKSGGLLILKGSKIVSLQTNNERIYLFAHPRSYVGRGIMNSNSITLRLERRDKTFYGYCKGDNNQWYSCGWIDMKMDDPLQIGIFAECMFIPSLTTNFEYFKIYRS